MANKDNKEFLDKLGVQKLWDKINQYFSQIGHRHETSDVNGLDEYMEENAKAIRDTEKVIEILPTLPLYPSEEQVGNIYACNGRLYRAKKLNTLTLDFSKIPTNEEGYVTREIFMDFINQNGMNIVMDYTCIDPYSGEEYETGDINFYNETIKDDALFIRNDWDFNFTKRKNSELFNQWNQIYVKSYNVTIKSNYDDDDEVSYGVSLLLFWPRYDGGEYIKHIEISDEYPPLTSVTSEIFGEDGTYPQLPSIADLSFELSSVPSGRYEYLLKSLTLDLVRCDSPEDYEEGIFHDFLVWEEISEEELPIEDTTPATEETRKRFYRETPNDNIYVTDKEEHYEPGGFEIIINCNTISQKDDDEVKELIDPENLWVDYIDEVTNCYGAPFLNNNPPINFTPLRIGTSNPGNIALEATQNVVLKFSPYFQYYNGEWQSETAEEDADITIYLNGDEYYNITIPRYQGGNNIESLQYYEISIPIGYIDIEVSRRVYLHTISHGNKETTYKWSQIAKVQDIHDAINALPEVARTGSYTDLFNKPCIGDVQTYDWPSNEDLPIIDEGTGNCDNRLKQLLRYNSSLYTAVVNESGLSVDLRDFSKKYNTQGYCGNKLRTYIFEDRIDAVSGAYQDYFVTGNTILIQNTKGIGMQIGSSNSYGEMLLAMRSEGDNQRYLFNNVDVTLQSWSSDGEKTTDNANIYVEIGTSEAYENTHIVYDDTMSELKLSYFDFYGFWIIGKMDGTELTTDEMSSLVNSIGDNLYIDGETYHIEGFYNEYSGLYFSVELVLILDHYNNLDTSRGYPYTNLIFRKEKIVTDYTHNLTPQQTKNVWFKRYGDEYVEEWEETSYWTEFEEVIPSEDYMSYYVYDDNTGDYAYDFLYSLVENQVLKINGVELIVKEVLPDDGILRVYYNDNEPSGYISILRRRYVNNPVLKETVSLQGTNCDYIKIWTQYDEDPEQYGRRGVIKTIMFNDLRYEYDPNPTYNRDICKKDYWKQISGNGSIKVIDLTGDE